MFLLLFFFCCVPVFWLLRHISFFCSFLGPSYHDSQNLGIFKLKLCPNPFLAFSFFYFFYSVCVFFAILFIAIFGVFYCLFLPTTTLGEYNNLVCYFWTPYRYMDRHIVVCSFSDVCLSIETHFHNTNRSLKKN